MRYIISVICFLLCIITVVAFDVEVSIRDHVTPNASNITDAYMVENLAYPNGSPFSVKLNTTIDYVTNESEKNKSRIVSDVNKYTYADTSNITITPNTSRICAKVYALNRTDTNQSNNKACKAFRKLDDPGLLDSNSTSNESSPFNSSERTPGDKTVSNASNKSSEMKCMNESPSPEDSRCDLVSDVPALTPGDEAIEFRVNADNGPVTYWVENRQGEIVKSQVTTTNTGIKQYTPDDEELLVFKASAQDCDDQTVTAGVVSTKTESYLKIKDVTADRPNMQVEVSHHHSESRVLTVTTQDKDMATVTLPAGTTDLTTSFPTESLESGISKLRVKAGEDSESYRYMLKQEALSDRYPRLIDSVYHRKEDYGPTTIYVSLKERVNGELVVRQDNGLERKDINGTNVEATVMPSKPQELLGVAVNNRLGETLDEQSHLLDLDWENQTERSEKDETPSPAARSAPADQNDSTTLSVNESAATSSKETMDAFRGSSDKDRRPYISAAGLIATLGYFAYWLRGRS